MTALWRHSVGCSIACHELGVLLKLDSADELFIAGLLHDIGKVITADQLPDARQEINVLVQEEDLNFRDAEERVIGLAHSRIGGWLAEHWNLPLHLRQALAHHHGPTKAQEHTTIASVVHVGDFLTRLFEFGSGGDDHLPSLDPHALKHLGMHQRQLGMAIDIVGEKFEQKGIDLF
jgi:HD-like signal output (HDOD) protein